VSENCAETRPSSPAGTRLEGVPPASHGYWYNSGDALPNTWSQSRRLAVYF
jgi:hypothetical protein